MEPPKLFSLAEVVRTTADELRKIQADEPAPDKAVMRFSECEIEVSATVSADASGKVTFWVVQAGVGASYENAQKVTLKFTSNPQGPGIYALVAGPGAAPLPEGRGGATPGPGGD